MAYIGNQVTSVPFIADTFSGNGSQQSFNLTRAPAGTASIAVFIGTAYQAPVNYSLSGITLTFVSAPTSGTNNITVLHLGNGAATQVPSTGSVTLSTLGSDTYGYINAAFAAANSDLYSQATANAAFIRANNSLDANNGGTIAGSVIFSSTANVSGIVNITSSVTSTSNTTGALRISGGLGVQGNTYSSNTFALGDIVAGLADGVVLAGATNPIIAAIGNTDYYIQNYIVNYANTANGSADYVAYPNNGNDANGWIDMGITSNTYSQAIYNITGRNEGYVFMSAPGGSNTSGNLVFATDSTGTNNAIEFYTGGFAQGKTSPRMRVTNTGVTIANSTTTVANVTNQLAVFGMAYQNIATLVDATTITANLAQTNNFVVTLGGNRTLANATNITAGQSGFIVVRQDGTGSRTLSFGTGWRFPSATAPTLTTTASAVDLIVYTARDSGNLVAQAILSIT